MESLDNLLSHNRQNRISIHCIGDSMIDEYYPVDVKRISPEFPMPIMHSNTEECIDRPGGVANVAYQFKHFNVEAQLICFSDHLSTLVFRKHKLKFSPCTNVAVHVPRKRRFLDNFIQVKRWDIESPNYGLPEKEYKDAIKDSLETTEAIPLPDVAIFSDYGKGFFTKESCQAWMKRYAKCKTVVDPKNSPLSWWKGCTVFKPNKKEATELTGETDWRKQCDVIVAKTHCKAVVITLSGEGLVGWTEENGYFEYNPQYKIVPESVIGAGDAFVAFLSLSIAHGFSVEDASQLAYEAGSIYVQNKMNRPIVPAELSKTRCIQPEDLVGRDFKLVFTNGCFDILHRGHLNTLRFAKAKGEKLVVALNSDASVKRLKGESRPINPLEDRMALMAAIKEVDFVISFDEDTPYEVIKRCKPDVLVKGADYQIATIVGSDIVPETYVCPLVEGCSTTKIINRQKNQ